MSPPHATHMVWEAVWHSGYHRQLSSHRSPVRTRPVAVLPPTGLARPGTGAPPAFPSIFSLWPYHFPPTGQHQNCAHTPNRKNVPSHLQQCAPPPPTPDGRMPPHPLLAFARAAAPLDRRLGHWGSNLGPATLESRVLPVKHMAPHPYYDTANTQPARHKCIFASFFVCASLHTETKQPQVKGRPNECHASHQRLGSVWFIYSPFS